MASIKPTEFLGAAITAARAALDDMEADEIPVKLQRIRARSDRTLPVPLGMSLLREIAQSEDLRASALKAWVGERPENGSAFASYVFLERAPGWEIAFVVEALAAGQRRGTAADRSLEIERDSLAADVASLKEQLRRQRDDADRHKRELKTALDAERAPGRADRQTEVRLTERFNVERIAWAEREAKLSDRIAELETEVRRLQETARAERLARSELAATIEAGEIGALPTGPLELARHLDELAAHAISLAPGPVPQAAGGPIDDQGPLAIDPNVRPDQAEAIDWLMAAQPDIVFIDGYNVGFKLARLDPGRARALAVEVSGRLAVALGSVDVWVVFDASMDEDDDSRGSRSGNLAIMFTSGESADDAIVERVCGGDARAVVVTSDRALRQRVETCGAIALWSEGLLEWSRRR